VKKGNDNDKKRWKISKDILKLVVKVIVKVSYPCRLAREGVR
jgi:hypothetical protein